MSARHVFQVLLLTADPDLAELYRHECPDCVVTIAKDAAAAIRKTPKHRFDAVIVESRKDWMNEVKSLTEAMNRTPHVVLVGTPPFLRRASETVKGLSNGHLVGRSSSKLFHELGFDEYIGAKLRDFVRRNALPLGLIGLGAVWLAEDAVLERRVALKALDVPDATGELAARLLREARILARLEHPGIVPVHDASALPDGRVFYAMKFVEGRRLDLEVPEATVRERLRSWKPPAPRYERGIFAKYARLVSSASEGAVTGFAR